MGDHYIILLSLSMPGGHTEIVPHKGKEANLLSQRSDGPRWEQMAVPSAGGSERGSVPRDPERKCPVCL